jgi:hypothetical protein
LFKREWIQVWDEINFRGEDKSIDINDEEKTPPKGVLK